MEICRAREMLDDRFLERISSGDTLNVRLTSSTILDTVTGAGWSLFRISAMAFCAVMNDGAWFSSR